jgi:hypothetical protein
MILIISSSFILNIIGINQNAVATFYSPQTRCWELLSGSLLAWIVLFKKDTYLALKNKMDIWISKLIYISNKNHKTIALESLLSFVGLFLLIYGFFQLDTSLLFPGKWALLPVVGTVLIIAAGSKAYINRTILSNKISVWFGLISFPLYLWHWPILSFIRIIDDEPSRKVRIAAVILSIVLAFFT